MGDLTFQYPVWYLSVCALFGVFVTVISYYRDSRFADQAGWLRALLPALRFTVVFLVSSLLLMPVLQTIATQTKDPIIVFLQDASRSVPESMSEAQLAAYQASISSMLGSLENQYQVDRYSFGDVLSAGLDEKGDKEVTNLSKALSDICDLYTNQNVGALIVATDGIYNRGSNPLYASKRLAAPLHTIGLGDTTARRDVVLRKVFHNRIAYLGDKFTVEIDVQALNCAGERPVLTVQRIGTGSPQTVHQEALEIKTKDFFQTREVVLDADQPGMQRYQVSLTQLNGEASVINNARDIFVDVLDARQQILIVGSSPHPDISALRQAITINRNYEVTVSMADEFDGNLESFDMVILHQIPGMAPAGKTLLTQLDELNLPRLHILGMQTDFSRLDHLENLVQLTVDGQNTNDVQASVDPAFSLFSIDEILSGQLPSFAPLIAPFGNYEAGPAGQVMLWQRIGKIDTKYPLFVFGESKSVRTGILTAEGLWKWRLFDFLKNGNHDLFDGMVAKIVQYLSVREDKRRFRVEAASNIFAENEPVILSAELYNASYELVNESDVSVTIINEQGEEYDFVCSRSGKSYTLNAGFFPMGNYRYVAEAVTGGGTLTAEGRFSVESLQLEAFETTARHGMLQRLSEQNGGSFFRAESIGALSNLIKSSEVRPVVYQTDQNKPLMHFKWVFALLAALLALEWFLRRFYGAY